MQESKRLLIVNADDFGLSGNVNQGIIRAHESGLVTSASLLVRRPPALEAAEYARTHPRLSLGLHFDIAEWNYVAGAWVPIYQVVPSDDALQVRREAWRQVSAFRRLVGGDPTHIDSHQHVHRVEPARSVLREIAEELGVPLRECTQGIRYCGRFYGQTGTGQPLPENITLEALLAIITRLPPGVTELGCHPGLSSESTSTYGNERWEELVVLCAPRARAALAVNGVILCSFRDIVECYG